MYQTVKSGGRKFVPSGLQGFVDVVLQYSRICSSCVSYMVYQAAYVGQRTLLYTWYDMLSLYLYYDWDILILIKILSFKEKSENHLFSIELNEKDWTLE